MVLITRILVGLAGLLFVALAMGFWFDSDASAARFGLTNLYYMGHATVRADIGGFFLTGGIISLYAAIRRNAACLWPNLLLLGSAITGRALTLLLNGGNTESYPPMIVEAALIILILVCRRTWPKPV